MNFEPTISMDIAAQDAAYDALITELEPHIKRSARQMRRQDRRAAIDAYYSLNLENGVDEHVQKYAAAIQAVVKRHPVPAFRRACLLAKRHYTNTSMPDFIYAEGHPHGSRAIRRKVSHDARKGTKPGLFGRGSVKLTDADLVERHGRPAMAVLSAERFQAALEELWASGRRLDLKPKTKFQLTVEALSEVMGRRVSA